MWHKIFFGISFALLITVLFAICGTKLGEFGVCTICSINFDRAILTHQCYLESKSLVITELQWFYKGSYALLFNMSMLSDWCQQFYRRITLITL